MNFQTASLSERGGKTRNEDAYGAWADERLLVCVVADGVGGHGAGDVASRLAVETSLDEIARVGASGATLDGAALTRVLFRANDAILDAQERAAQTANMRSTAVVLAVDAQRRIAAWAHCGDSRLYCFRNGATLVCSRDHSLVQNMVDAQLISAQEARAHPRRNVLFGALGSAEELPVASVDRPHPLEPDDVFLLCTDGFWEYVDESAMLDTLAIAATPAAWLKRMTAQLRQAARPNHDNYTATAVWCNAGATV